MAASTVTMQAASEWAIAYQVQQRFMEHRVPACDRIDYSGRCRQMHDLGGDCYDFWPLPQDRFALAIGDASGKGLAAALMIATVQSSLRTAASFSPDDGAMAVAVVNRQVHASSLADRFATLFFGVFDDATRTLRYVNAGHNPPVVIRPDGSVLWLDAGGPPVGMFPHSDYEESSVALHPGDLVLLYTDGVVEALNAAGEEWGVENLRLAAARSRAQSAEDIVQMIFASLDEFSAGRQSDDATVAVLRVH